jgi:hypothetical protein
VGLVTIFYCLWFETSLFADSYDSQGCGGGIRSCLRTGRTPNQSQRYVTTGGLPPISSSWRRAPCDSWLEYFLNWTPSVIGRVCCLQLLLALASAFILGPESLGTRDHILLPQIRDFLFVASYDSQGCGGGIRPRLHMGKRRTPNQSQSQSETELLYDWRFTANQFVFAPSPLRLTDRKYFSQLNTCGHSPYILSSLTRGWVFHLQLLLPLASALTLGSESRGTRDHILLSQIRDFPFCSLLRLAGLRWSYSTPPPHGNTPNLSLSLSLTLRPTLSRPVCLGIKHPSGAYDQIFITIRLLRVCWCGALSLTRGRVCHLQ